MFGDGKIQVIDHEGDLYINMWEMVQHLINSSIALENMEGSSQVSTSLRLVASTLCDLALYELGMDKLKDFESVQSIIDFWDSHRE